MSIYSNRSEYSELSDEELISLSHKLKLESARFGVLQLALKV